jgi:polyphosphate kinase 2 (PPK2 family)
MLETIDPSVSITKDEYLNSLIPLQVAINALGYQVYVQQRPVILVYEGWDAGGKGGNIKRVTEKLDPRGYVVHAISAPKGDDKTHHYLWRFWRRLPEKGQIAIFDRTWYGRVMVERIEGFCTEDEWKRAFREINRFERQLVDFGTILFKFWIHISDEEQLRRFEARKVTPHKSWKLTDEDWRNRDRWNDYELAVNDMLRKTSTLTAPWTIVEGDCKWYARIKVLKTLVDGLSSELNFDPSVDMPSLKGIKKKGRKPGKAKKQKDDNAKADENERSYPTIQEFEYGKVVIDNKLFERDIVLTADGSIAEWTRENEHEITVLDIKNVLTDKPSTVIFGIGTIGNVVVSPEALDWLKQSKIKVISYKTEKAIETYRHMSGKQKVAAFFHIQD